MGPREGASLLEKRVHIRSRVTVPSPRLTSSPTLPPKMGPGCHSCPHDRSAPLTEMISAREMLGAMLRMKREQVLWRGRGLHSSPAVSLGFSLSSSLGFSFSLSASSGQKVVAIGDFFIVDFGGSRGSSHTPTSTPPSPKRAAPGQLHPLPPPLPLFRRKRMD